MTSTSTDQSSSSVAARVAGLRGRADTDAAAARDETWQWFLDLKQRSGDDRKGSDAEMDELFLTGTVPTGLDGPTDGILITTTTNALVDPAVRAVTNLWMPWQGKRFDAQSATGDNRMTSSSSLPSKLLWPLYRMKDAQDGKLAFDFKTYEDAGKDDPELQVMVIDYADVEDNPRLVIRSIRDELVEIVAGAFLGKILFRTPRGNYEKIGFFALRTPS
jgi:hypothetical protein